VKRRRWKAAGAVAGITAAGWLAAVAVAVGVLVKGGKLIEEAQEECAG
jgi:hypothetical protein